jgi:hypothetical protein
MCRPHEISYRHLDEETPPMKKFLLIVSLATAMLLVAFQEARAVGPHKVANRWGERYARTMPWNGQYYYAPWGAPVSLVVPPVSNMQTSMGWGVTQTEMMPIYHQFARPYPGDGAGGGVGFLATPRWPSHTDQFGVYYVRGPWR